MDAALGLLRLGNNVFGFRNRLIVHVQDDISDLCTGFGHLAIAQRDDLYAGGKSLCLRSFRLQGSPVERYGTIQIYPVHRRILRFGGMECDFGREFLSVTDIGYNGLVARTVIIHPFLDGCTVRNLLAIDGDNHIALLQAGFLRGASLRNLNYLYAVHRIKFQFFLNFFINWLHLDAKKGALDGSEVDQVGRDTLDDVHRNGEGIA